MMTKPLHFSAIFFLLFAVSHASRFDLNLINLDHHEDDNLIKSTSSSSSNGGEDPLIRLPTETSSVPDLTQSSDTNNNKKQPQLKTTSSDLNRLTNVDLDLTQLMNRRPVHLRNRFRFPLIRYIPRRCRHFHRFSGLSAVDLREELAEIIRHRHVSRKFPEDDNLDAQFVSFIPVNHYHRDDHHEGEVDRTVEMKRENEEYDGEWKGDHHHRHHHHEHHHDDEEKHEKKKKEKKKKDDFFHKIRKFLTHF